MGKSTVSKNIVPLLRNGASFDAENILQVNPFEFNESSQPEIYLIVLQASKEKRDVRRIERSKPTTKEQRDWLDAKYPPDTTLKAHEDSRDYKYIAIDSSALTVGATLGHLKDLIPDIFE